MSFALHYNLRGNPGVMHRFTIYLFIYIYMYMYIRWNIGSFKVLPWVLSVPYILNIMGFRIASIKCLCTRKRIYTNAFSITVSCACMYIEGTWDKRRSPAYIYIYEYYSDIYISTCVSQKSQWDSHKRTVFPEEPQPVADVVCGYSTQHWTDRLIHSSTPRCTHCACVRCDPPKPIFFMAIFHMDAKNRGACEIGEPSMKR